MLSCQHPPEESLEAHAWCKNMLFMVKPLEQVSMQASMKEPVYRLLRWHSLKEKGYAGESQGI